MDKRQGFFLNKYRCYFFRQPCLKELLNLLLKNLSLTKTILFRAMYELQVCMPNTFKIPLKTIPPFQCFIYSYYFLNWQNGLKAQPYSQRKSGFKMFVAVKMSAWRGVWCVGWGGALLFETNMAADHVHNYAVYCVIYQHRICQCRERHEIYKRWF